MHPRRRQPLSNEAVSARSHFLKEEMDSMKAGYKIAVMSSAVLVLASGFLYSGKSVNAAAEGKITGTIKLEGTPPRQRPIDMSKEPSCAKIHESNPVHTENVVVGSGGGLQNVVVYISEGLTGNEATATSSATPDFDQKGCQYIPHVLSLNPNQHFKVTNSDQTSHNIHPMPKQGGPNHEWNKSQPPGSPPFDVTWTNEEVGIPVKCNIHPWMHGYHVVVKGPNATSDSSGSYTLSLPPGSYTVTAWQEELGTQTQKVTVS
jgi:plastocyanin